jgi:phage shock protein E
MKKTITIILVVVALVGGVFVLGSGSSNNDPDLSFDTVTQDVNNGSLLLDVRTPVEYASGHFTGAQNLSLQDIQANTLPNVAKDTTIYVYCQSGNRSGQATKLLERAGYTNIIDLGGLQDVRSIGGTI